MPILHLIDAASTQACPTTLAVLAAAVARDAQYDPRVLLMGGQQLADDARDAGLTQFDLLGVPFRQPLLGLPAVIRKLKATGPVDHVWAWSSQSLRVARIFRGRTPRTLALTQLPSPAELDIYQRWIEDGDAAPTRITTISQAMRGKLIEMGLPAPRIDLLDLPLQTGRFDVVSSAALREQWDIDEHTRVIALLSDPPGRADMQAAVMAAGLAHFSLKATGTHQQIALLVHPDQLHHLRAQQVVYELGSHISLIQDARLASPWELLPACDAALVMDADCDALSLQWALAAGCPIATVPKPLVNAAEANSPAIHIAKTSRAKALAHELHQILAQPAATDVMQASLAEQSAS